MANLKGRRRGPLVLTLVSIAVIGGVISLLPGEWSLTTVDKAPLQAPVEPTAAIDGGIDRGSWQLVPEDLEPDMHARQQLEQQTRILFEHALLLQQQQRYLEAVKALELVITVAPTMPEAFVNLGFALYEVNELDAARGAFLRALDLNPAQGNAYYGAAIVYEALGELELALGAMRSFLHLTEGQERFKARARAAIWEWENAKRDARHGITASASTGSVSGERPES